MFTIPLIQRKKRRQERKPEQMKEYKLCWDIELERIKMKTLNGRQYDNDDVEKDGRMVGDRRTLDGCRMFS